MKNYRVTVKVRNNLLLRAIEESGGTTGQKWCDAHSLDYCRVNDLINMTLSPLTSQGEMRAVATKLCDVLGKLPEELWSNEQLRPLERNFSDMEMDYSQICSLLPGDEQSYLMDTSGIENDQIRHLVNNALSTLSQKEQEVIRLRYYEDMPLDAIAEQFVVTKERIRQIEAKALRRLRHYSRSMPLIDCLDVSADLRMFVTLLKDGSESHST